MIEPILYMTQQGQIPPWKVDPGDIIPEGTDPNAGGNPDGAQDGNLDGSIGIGGKLPPGSCKPTFSPLGDNSAWFVFRGVEAALIVLMLVGILAILFGNQEANSKMAQVAMVAA